MIRGAFPLIWLGGPDQFMTNRVFGNMRANRHHEEYFDHNEYILSYLALENSKYIVLALKNTS